MHIRRDDMVEVIAGDDKGTPKARKIARVLRVLPKENKVVVEGVNRVYRHLKPSKRNPQGGRLSKEMPIDASNVMFIDPAQNRPTRVGVRYLPDGSKELYAKKSGTRIRMLSKEMPVSASNVMFVDPQTNSATRVGVRYLPDGSKELFAKKSKTRIRLLSKPNPKYASKK